MIRSLRWNLMLLCCSTVIANRLSINSLDDKVKLQAQHTSSSRYISASALIIAFHRLAWQLANQVFLTFLTTCTQVFTYLGTTEGRNRDKGNFIWFCFLHNNLPDHTSSIFFSKWRFPWHKKQQLQRKNKYGGQSTSWKCGWNHGGDEALLLTLQCVSCKSSTHPVGDVGSLSLAAEDVHLICKTVEDNLDK